MPSIQFVTPGLGLGGAERSLVKFANQLDQLGHSTSIIVFSKSDSSILAEGLGERIKVRTMKGGRSSSPLTWFRAARIIRRDQPDVVFGWSLFANLMVCLLGRFIQLKKIVISERVYLPEVLGRNSPQSKFRRWLIWTLVRTLYPTADVITANSETNLKFIRRYLGPVAQYRLLPNIIDVEQVDGLVRGDIDIEYNDSRPRILAVGRLHHQKGFDTLLEAFEIVRRERDWQLVIVGDGPERESLKELAKSLGISESLVWAGSKDNPFPYYAWSDMVVVSSRYEGFPNVPLEAMACGRPVICTDCRTGPRELTSNGRFGRLVPVDSPTALAGEIIKMGDSDRIRTDLGSAAREHVVSNYGLENVEAMLRNILSSAE